jgi:hypothetical protein
MIKTKSNSKISTIALILILTLSTMLVILPHTSAQEQPHKTTYAICRVMPNPIGVNQEVLIHVGITDYLIVYTDGWEGLSITITDPDGEVTTIDNIRTDATGGTGRTFTPTKVGTYHIQTHFPAQEYLWTDVPVFDPDLVGQTVLYEASDSEIVDLIVQANPIEYYPSKSLPTEFWTRPVDAQLREWSSIAGNWLAPPHNRYAPYNDAPETAHILWTRPLATGGLVGGDLGQHAYEEGDAYEGKFADWEAAAWGGGSAVIINGILYYNRYTTGSFDNPFIERMWKQQGVYAVDLHTGEELWFKNNTRLTFGQLFYWDSFNYHGTFPYIWEISQSFNFTTFTTDTTWTAYDPLTGEFAYRIEKIPDGERLYGPKGEIYIYTINLEQGWMTLWNSSRCVQPQNTNSSTDGSWGSEANIQKTFNAARGIEWNRTIPLGLPGRYTENQGVRTQVGIREVFLFDRIMGSDAPDLGQVTLEKPITTWAVSLQPGHEGTLIFNETWQPPAGDLTISWGAASLEDEVFTLWSKEQRAHYGFNIDTGKPIWGPTQSQVQLDIYGIVNSIAYGKLFSAGYGGVVYAYDVQTGERAWEPYVADDPYTEILWSNNWPLPVTSFIADGKIYLAHNEHSPVDPKPRGAPFICIDVETGEVVWRADGLFRGTDWGGHAIIGDGIIATMDTYDQRVYAIGKGPTATTVEAPLVAVPKGTSITIRGMVTDVSPGAQEYGLTARFPDGVPAIADEDMSDWMLYVYKQFPRPDVDGVTVTLDAVNPSGEFINIGTVTSDSSGLYSYKWTPGDEGKYTIIASFMGSKAYWPSYSETAVSVDPVSSGGPIEPETQPPLITTEVAILIAVIVIAAVAIAAYWVLRRR